MIKKTVSLLFIYASIAFFIPAFSSAQDSTINEGDFGVHLRAAFGTGDVAYGYINNSSESGDLGSGDGTNLNIAAMFSYTFFGFEFNYLGGDINDLEWTAEESGTEYDYKSTGSGNYNEYDWKIGARLFTEPQDMGYTYIFIGKRYWNTERKQDTREWDIYIDDTNIKYEAKGDGWIFGIRDFTTIDVSDSIGIVIQSGLFFGSAPLTSLKANGAKVTLPDDKDPFTFGAELGAGVSFTNIGLSIVGGMRGEFNLTMYNDSTEATEDESVFGFGSSVYYIEAGMMF